MRVSTFFLLTGVTSAAAVAAPKPNPEIAGVVKEISARDLEANIRKLVSFGTRHTLSDATSETRGIAVPAGVEMETNELTNDTTLRGEANREPDLAGYEVFWRETTAPFWQHSVFPGKVTSFTVPKVSKDNFLFGVAAVDQDGNRSLAVYPAPSAK